MALFHRIDLPCRVAVEAALRRSWPADPDFFRVTPQPKRTGRAAKTSTLEFIADLLSGGTRS